MEILRIIFMPCYGGLAVWRSVPNGTHLRIVAESTNVGGAGFGFFFPKQNFEDVFSVNDPVR